MSKRNILIVVIGVVMISGGLAIGWMKWTHSPTYTIREIAVAVQQRDRYKFDRYVDVDGLIQSILADYSDGAPLAMAMAGALTASLKQQVAKVIEDGTVNPDSQFGQGLSNLMTKPAALQFEQQGPNAYFLVPIKTKGGAPFDVRFHMTQVPDGCWRVDRITNVKELISTEASEEAARKAALEKRIDEQLAKISVMAKLHTSVAHGWSRINRFQVKLQNKLDKTVSRFTGKIACHAAGFDAAIKGTMLMAAGETSNATWEFHVNQFEAETENMYALGETDGFDVEIDSVEFEDGSHIKRGEVE